MVPFLRLFHTIFFFNSHVCDFFWGGAFMPIQTEVRNEVPIIETCSDLIFHHTKGRQSEILCSSTAQCTGTSAFIFIIAKMISSKDRLL